MLPTFIDIEASGLGRKSFPIEVAWNAPDGSITNRLIKPVVDWTSWDPQAERVHGIAREVLENEGISPTEMCALMREALQGETLYSDAPEFERFWLDRLFDAGENGASPFLVQGVSDIPEIRKICYQIGKYDRFKREAIAEVGLTHRADADVKVLMGVLRRARTDAATSA